jgi:hypothetical protein
MLHHTDDGDREETRHACSSSLSINAAAVDHAYIQVSFPGLEGHKRRMTMVQIGALTISARGDDDDLASLLRALAERVERTQAAGEQAYRSREAGAN